MFKRILKVSNWKLLNNFLSKTSATRRFQSVPVFSLPFVSYKVVQCCEKSPYNFNHNTNTLEHEYFIKQACTSNVNSASQLLTVTILAIQDTSQQLRECLTREICLIRQALEWGDQATPDEHFEAIIEVRGTLLDLRHNLQVLIGYLEYAERMATLSAEVSFITGNVGASDIICERINLVGRMYRSEVQQNESLTTESLALQSTAIESKKIKEIFDSEQNAKNVEHAV